ncbi:hypothetical protein [Rhizobium leguminosarum]|uniref:hypothetical protein n=1 Tax=Rhizobium leguminosarum TaxID=384 RepID=UPI001441E2EF|nr:hypothetical protein [Rhizobium leguminosarum]NKL67659.1 hypothetical protein [Rhizobium leguminosarum bv. viciae]
MHIVVCIKHSHPSRANPHLRVPICASKIDHTHQEQTMSMKDEEKKRDQAEKTLEENEGQS